MQFRKMSHLVKMFLDTGQLVNQHEVQFWIDFCEIQNVHLFTFLLPYAHLCILMHTYAYLCTLMHTQRCLTHHLCFLSWNLTRYMQQEATTTLEMSSQCLSNNFCTTKQANHSLRASPITSTCSFCFCLCTGKS